MISTQEWEAQKRETEKRIFEVLEAKTTLVNDVNIKLA